MTESLTRSFAAATDIAEYLVKKDVPFREAYNSVGSIVKHCIAENKQFSDLSLEEWKSLNSKFDSDIQEKISVEACVDARDILGGTSRKQVKEAIKFSEKRLKNEN